MARAEQESIQPKQAPEDEGAAVRASLSVHCGVLGRFDYLLLGRGSEEHITSDMAESRSRAKENALIISCDVRRSDLSSYGRRPTHRFGVDLPGSGNVGLVRFAKADSRSSRRDERGGTRGLAPQ